jgi:hypothetical protein
LLKHGFPIRTIIIRGTVPPTKCPLIRLRDFLRQGDFGSSRPGRRLAVGHAHVFTRVWLMQRDVA